MTHLLDLVSVEPFESENGILLELVPWIFAAIVATVAVMIIIDVIKKHRR